jgi:hypothetical protein
VHDTIRGGTDGEWKKAGRFDGEGPNSERGIQHKKGTLGEARAKELKTRIGMAIKTLNEAVIDDWDPTSGFK